MCAWYQPGSATLSAGARLTPTTIVSAVNLTTDSTTNSTTVDVSNYLSKSFKITLTTGVGSTITDYRVQVKCLSSDTDSNYAEITKTTYEADGIYHWSIEDVGKWIRVDIKSWGTATSEHYVTVTITIEGSAS